MPTRQQQFAIGAYNKIQGMNQTVNREEYVKLCKRIPALIHHNGLALTIAFCEEKASSDTQKYQHYRIYLHQLLQSLSLTGWDEVRNAEHNVYQRLTLNALEAAAWYKRYAEALLSES